jgi:hypothetical protein
MSRKRIDELTSIPVPATADVVPVVDVTTGITYKLTIQQILALGLSGSLGFYIRFGAVVASETGTKVDFVALFGDPFTNTDYAFIPYGIKNGGNVDVEIASTDDSRDDGLLKTVSETYVYPAEDDTTVYFIAIGV